MIEPKPAGSHSQESFTRKLHSPWTMARFWIFWGAMLVAFAWVAARSGAFWVVVATLALVAFAWIVLYQAQALAGFRLAREALKPDEPLVSCVGVEGNAVVWLGRAVVAMTSSTELVALRCVFTKATVIWKARATDVRVEQIDSGRRSTKWKLISPSGELTLRTSKREAAEMARTLHLR